MEYDQVCFSSLLRISTQDEKKDFALSEKKNLFRKSKVSRSRLEALSCLYMYMHSKCMYIVQYLQMYHDDTTPW